MKNISNFNLNKINNVFFRQTSIFMKQISYTRKKGIQKGGGLMQNPPSEGSKPKVSQA